MSAASESINTIVNIRNFEVISVKFSSVQIYQYTRRLNSFKEDEVYERDNKHSYQIYFQFQNYSNVMRYNATRHVPGIRTKYEKVAIILYLR